MLLEKMLQADGPQPDVQSFNCLMGVLPEKKVRESQGELCWVKKWDFSVKSYGKQARGMKYAHV